MPPKKAAAPSPIKGTGFSGSDPLTPEDWETITVDSAADAPRALLDAWNGKILGFTVAQLGNDNKTISHLTFNLAGTLWDRGHTVSANRYWDTEPGTQLHFPTIDTSVFSFEQGSLCSSLVGHEEVTHEWRKDGTSTQAFRGFSLRAYVAPFEEHWANLWILLFPLGKEELLAAHPLAENAAFPGIAVCDVEFPLGFNSLSVLPDSTWGSPITPAVITGAPWEEQSSPPATAHLRKALADTLRTATKPEVKQNFTTLLPRWAELTEGGEAALKPIQPNTIWPLQISQAQRRGRFFLFFLQPKSRLIDTFFGIRFESETFFSNLNRG